MKKIAKPFMLIFTLLVILALSILYREIGHQENNSIPVLRYVKQDSIHHNTLLDNYYSCFISIYLDKNTKFDRNKIPVQEIKGQLYYHPIFMSQLALGAYEYYLSTQDLNAYNTFIRCACWLRDNLKQHGRFYYWEFTFENDQFPGGAYKVPWVSAMAQGEGAAVLTKAFAVTGDNQFLYAAKKAIQPVLHDVSEGGISIVAGNEYIFPQEYLTIHPSSILNGGISSFFGIYEYYMVTRDQSIKHACDVMLKTFYTALDRYDNGYWSLYSQWPPAWVAPPHYQTVHVQQLYYLYLISGDRKFLIYSTKFRDYQDNWINRTRYVLSNHLRQVRQFSFKKIPKIVQFLKTPY
jgi:hypothetical protein